MHFIITDWVNHRLCHRCVWLKLGWVSVYPAKQLYKVILPICTSIRKNIFKIQSLNAYWDLTLLTISMFVILVYSQKKHIMVIGFFFWWIIMLDILPYIYDVFTYSFWSTCSAIMPIFKCLLFHIIYIAVYIFINILAHC